MDKHNLKPKINYWRKNTLMERSKQTKVRGNKNYVTQNIRIVNK
jgi:hypothetical protein